jgi:hypothetical protein
MGQDKDIVCPDCVPYEGEAAISNVVMRSGCESEYREMEKCFEAHSKSQRLGPCQTLMKAFQQCLLTKQNYNK